MYYHFSFVPLGLRRPGGALFKKTAPPNPPRKNFLLLNKGGHGLPKRIFRQTMTAFNNKLLQGVQGGGFLEKNPPG
jgi:hypothetical protein